MSAPPIDAGLAEVLEALPPVAGLDATRARLADLGSPGEVQASLRRVAAAHPAPRVRFQAERVLRSLPGALPALDLGDPVDPGRVREALASKEASVRLAATPAAAALGPELGTPLLVAAIMRPEDDPWTLATMVGALGQVGGEGAAEEVAALLDHPVPRVAANALEALSRLEPRTAVYASHPRLESPDNRMRANAVRVVLRANPELGWRHLEEMTAHADPWMRASAVWLLAEREGPEARALLETLLHRDPDPEVRARAARALGVEAPAQGAPLPATGALAAAPAEASRVPDDMLADLFAADLGLDEAEGAPASSDPGPAAPPEAQPEPAAESWAGDPDGALRVAMAALGTRNAQRALEIVAPFVERGDAPPRLELVRVLAFLQLRELGEAMAARRRLDLDSLGPPELHALATGLQGAGSHKAAIEVLEVLARQAPEYQGAARRLQDLQLRRAQIPPALVRGLEQRFSELRVIGSGGMGSVLRAVEREGGRAVALKIPGAKLVQDPEARARFEAEITTLARLEHPNIVRIFEVSTGDYPCYTMELLDGPGYDVLFADQAPMPAARALELLAPVASALGFVHAHDIIHCDVKPANVLLPSDGRPRLTDFGIAVQKKGDVLSESGSMIGTMTYMAPEQVQGGEVGPAADVYAWGVTLYEALTGSPPFARGNPLLKLYRDPPRPSELFQDGVPQEVENLVMACLARDLEIRIRSGGELMTVLRKMGFK